MHFFGLWGTVVFFIGFIAVVVVGGIKLSAIIAGERAPLVTDMPYFYLALTTMVIGVQMFLTGFLGELISRASGDRNDYKIAKEI